MFQKLEFAQSCRNSNLENRCPTKLCFHCGGKKRGLLGSSVGNFKYYLCTISWTIHNQHFCKPGRFSWRVLWARWTCQDNAQDFSKTLTLCIPSARNRTSFGNRRRLRKENDRFGSDVISAFWWKHSFAGQRMTMTSRSRYVRKALGSPPHIWPFLLKYQIELNICKIYRYISNGKAYHSGLSYM